MASLKKILLRLLSGSADRNLRFDDVVRLLKHWGFEERIRGDHHIFSHPAIHEILNLQPRGAQAKAYQVAQIREIIVREGWADLDDPRDESM
jgi:hypothetical protein